MRTLVLAAAPIARPDCLGIGVSSVSADGAESVVTFAGCATN